MAAATKRRATDQTTPQVRLAHLEQAIARGGGILQFARDMGVTHQAVGGWRKRRYVPMDRAVMIESRYGVPREALVLPEVAALYLAPRAVGSELV